MPAEPKKQEEGVFRKPGVKHQRTEEPFPLRQPHDDLIKPERHTDGGHAGAAAVDGGNLHTVAAVESESSEAANTRRDAGVVRVIAQAQVAPSVVTRGAAEMGAGPAAPARVGELPGNESDETWLRFQQHFGRLLKEDQLRLCQLVYERSMGNAEGWWFDTQYSEVGKLVGVSKRTAIRLVGRVERHGFMRRETRASGRDLVGVRLTFINPFSTM